MKKFYLLLVLLLIGYISVDAETTDTEAPKLKSFNFFQSTYSPGDIIPVKIDVKDDISGVLSIDFMFCNEISESCISDLSLLYSPLKEGEYTYNYKLPITTKNGNYKLHVIRIFDRNMNNRCYIADLQRENKYFKDCIEIDGFELKIDNDNEYKYPQIENFKISGNDFKVGDKISFEVMVKEADKIKDIIVNYDKLKTVRLARVNNTNVYRGSGEITIPGKDSFISLYVTDINNVNSNYTYSTYTATNSISKLYNIFKPNVYDFNVEGEQDTTTPILNNIKYEQKDYKVPSIIKINLDAYDNINNNIDTIQIDLKKLNNNGLESSQKLSTHCKGKDHEYICKFELNQYSDIGEYLIDNIIISDKTGNSIFYSTKILEEKTEITNNGKTNKYISLGNYKIKIVEDLNTEIISSSIAMDLIDKIKKSEDGSKISIDSSKNSIISKKVFEAIKNTNKTIYLETNGVVWIFNGKDIKEIKDIDVKVEINKLNDLYNFYKNYINKGIIILFADNGILPGKAKIRIKADYAFRNYVGEKDLNLYHEYNNRFDIISSNINITDDGYYEFNINHNSDYILTGDKINEKYINNNYEQELGNHLLDKQNDMINQKKNSNIVYMISIIVFITILAIIFVIIIIIYKKRNNKKINNKE